MNKEIMQQALDALKNGRNVRQGMNSNKLQISFENEAIAALEAELTKPEQELDYPPECTTPELEVAYAAGWWKALEVQRNKHPEHPLDKKAENARELGLDYEPDVYTNQQNVNTSEQPVHKSDKSIHEPVCNKDPQGCWSIRCQLGKICKNTAPPRKEWVGLTDDEIKNILNCGRGGLIDIKKAESKLREKNG